MFIIVFIKIDDLMEVLVEKERIELPKRRKTLNLLKAQTLSVHFLYLIPVFNALWKIPGVILFRTFVSKLGYLFFITKS